MSNESQHEIDYYRFNAICEHVGPHFLQYILNLELLPLPYNHEVFGSINFTQQHVEVLVDLEKIIAWCGQEAAKNGLYSLRFFLVRLGVSNQHQFNKYRKHCGGSIETIPGSDKLSGFLLRCIENLYPTLLISSLRDDPATFSESAHENPDLDQEFLELLSKDTAISALVTKEEHFTRFGYLLDNGFVAIKIQRGFFADFLVRAFYNCVYRMAFGLADVGREALSHLEQLRKIARKENVIFSQFIGLRGFRIQDSATWDLSDDWTIRSISHEMIPVRVVAKTYTILNGTPVGSILEVRHTAAGRILPEIFESRFNLPEIPRMLNNLKLATIFATKAVQAPFAESFADISLPMHEVAIPSPYHQSFFPAGGIVPSNDTDAIHEWFALLNLSDLSHVSVPIKRLELAIFQQRDEEDSIIDAVIAWEGMFSAKFETTFQVCLTIAKFLKSGLQERKDFFKRLKQLYGFRSSLAHGTLEIKDFQKKKKENSSDVRNEILRIGLDCLQKLLKNKKLLVLTPEERIKEILLG